MLRGPRILAVAGAAALAISLSACGGGDDGDTRQAIIDQMTEDADGPTEEQAGCMADGILAQFGEGRAKELLKVSDDAEISEVLTPDEQAKFAQLGVECVDTRAMIIDSLTASGFSAEDASCVAESLDDAQLQAMMQAGLAGEQPDQQALTDAVMDCGIAP